MIEEQITSYDMALHGVRKDVTLLHETESVVRMQNENHQRLLAQVRQLVEQLDLPDAVLEVLRSGDLAAPGIVQECLQAAATLEEKLGVQFGPGLSQLVAVRARLETFEHIRSNFVNRFTCYFEALLAQQIDAHAAHAVRRRKLSPYFLLLRWLQGVDVARFNSICKNYSRSVKLLYRTEIKGLVDGYKASLVGIFWLI